MTDNAKALLNTGTAIPAVPLALDANRRFDERRQLAKRLNEILGWLAQEGFELAFGRGM